MDGFYVAKLQKFANGVRGDVVDEDVEEEVEEEENEDEIEAARVATKAAITKDRKESRRKEAELELAKTAVVVGMVAATPPSC